MKSVVTGGAGFIGSHLTERLIIEGHDVVVIDSLITGRRENLSKIEDGDRVRFIEADVADLKTIAPYFEGADWVFHLAARADIVPSIQHPLDYHLSNVDGTISVLEASRAAGVYRFLYTASSTCYGLPDTFPTPESAPIRTMFPYALTKNLGEQYAMHWQQTYGLPVTSLRFFNVYGPRARSSGTYGAVFGVFLAQKLAGENFTVVGDGNQTRDFTFVSDIVDAYIAIAKSKTAGEVFNVGSGETRSINELVALLGGDVTYIPKRPGEPDCTFADISKIKNSVGWQPKVSFEDGVKIMLDNIDYWRDAPLWTPETIATETKEWFELLR